MAAMDRRIKAVLRDDLLHGECHKISNGHIKHNSARSNQYPHPVPRRGQIALPFDTVI